MTGHIEHNFSAIPEANIPRSSFDRSSDFKTTVDTGYLVPVWIDEYLPGDSFNVKVNIFGRMATAVTPFIDNLHASLFFFAVPNRLVWDNWQKFCGEQVNPGDSTDYLVPQVKMPGSRTVTYQGQTVEIGGAQPQSLFDYFGVPIFTPNIELSAFWSRAYNLIWNEWFRDENLQASVKVDKGDGPDSYDDYVLLRRGKRHDYFTSALPWPQKGPGVELPLGTTAPVTIANGGLPMRFTNTQSQTGNLFTGAGSNLVSLGTVSPSVASELYYTSGLQGVADLSSASAATINSFVQAFHIQRMYIRDALGGSRYSEILRSHFGVVSPDARLQRPEYLGGSSDFVDVIPVSQNSATDQNTTPQGNLTAQGIVSVNASFTKGFVEHGVLLCLLHIGADLTYQKGLNRMFSRRTRFDFYWPSLAHLGEQAVLEKEIHAQGKTNGGDLIKTTVAGVDINDETVYGYQERFAEYRYKPSLITGLLNSYCRDINTGAPNSLDVWHLAQKFVNPPMLNDEFIADNPPLKRVLALQNYPEFIIDGWVDCNCVRPMPVYSTLSLAVPRF